MLEKYAVDVVSLVVDEIIFSLDSPREIHDKMRGGEGIFDRAVEGLKSINTWKEKKKCRTPLINISSTIFETNYLHLDKIVDIVENLWASSITFHHLIFLNQQTYAHHNEIFTHLFNVTCQDWRGFVREILPNIDVEQLINSINNLKKRVSQTLIHFYPNLTETEIRQYYTDFNFKPSSYKHRCISPWMVAYICPDGSVRPCQSLNYVAGNVKEDTFRNIWNNQNDLRFRSVTKKKQTVPRLLPVY